jgi:putative methyltransferase (TIGR04325 family)
MSEARATVNTGVNSRFFRILARALEQKLPPLLALHRRLYQRHFAEQKEFQYVFAGVFPDFASARDAIPPGARVGCDHAEAVDRFGLALDTIWPSDYAALFWLSTLMTKDTPIFDLGGGLGRLFHGFKKYLQFPADLTWTICEVPAAVRRGRELAQAIDPRLSFTTCTMAASSAAILIASGSLELIEAPLWTSLSQLAAKPSHLLINRLALGEGPSFVTLFNMGPAITPCHIWNRDDFTKHLEDCGYTLIDRWSVPELSCTIPFFPERTIAEYSGMYLRRSATSP